MSLNAEERAKLVGLARQAVEAEASSLTPPSPADLCGVLGEKRGCFVTLTNKGRLRGCIGTFQPRLPLAEQICEMGAAAARDPRFVMDPVTSREFGELAIEVSVLSPLAPTNQPEKLEIGKHGIYVVRGSQAGCFLPEVATDMGWSAEQFLDHCCTGKAGLPAGAWRQSDTQVYLFTSEKFDR